MQQQICPKCQRSRQTSERIERDPVNKKKAWLITFCAKCGYNFDLQEYTGKITTSWEDLNNSQWQ